MILSQMSKSRCDFFGLGPVSAGFWGDVVFFFFRGWAREKLDVFFGVLFLPKKQGGFFFQKKQVIGVKS